MAFVSSTHSEIPEAGTIDDGLRSGLFKFVFTLTFMEGRHNEITLLEDDPDSIAAMLKAMYLGGEGCPPASEQAQEKLTVHLAAWPGKEIRHLWGPASFASWHARRSELEGNARLVQIDTVVYHGEVNNILSLFL